MAATLIVLRSKDSLSALPCTDSTTSCQDVPYSFGNCYVYNMFAWTLPFFFGLHFTYMDALKLPSFNLVPSKMRSWSKSNWVIFVLILLFVGWTLGSLIYFYIKAKVILYYLALLVALVLVFAIPAFVFRHTHELHVHHYNIGMVFVILIGY